MCHQGSLRELTIKNYKNVNKKVICGLTRLAPSTGPKRVFAEFIVISKIGSLAEQMVLSIKDAEVALSYRKNIT